jgi:peptidoglycan/LPS O-acetylase OafA/YrhL
MTAGQDRESGRVVTLDLLRGLAAFAVMVPHYFIYHRRGAGTLAETISIAAVEVFFVLSGFVLGPQIVLCVTRGNWVTLRTFLVRRWMRTIPSYIVALLAISIIFGEIGTPDFYRYMFYVQNLFWQHNTRDFYPVAWSLSIEEWYYAAFPVIVLAFGYFRRKNPGVWRQCVIAAIFFIVAITIGRVAFGSTSDWGAAVRRVVVFRIDSIAYGFLLYLFLLRAKLVWDLRLRCAASLALVATTASILYLDAALLAGDPSALLRYLHPFAAAAFGVSAVMFFLSIDAFVTPGQLKAICGYMGHISYPIYLFHLAVLFGLARAAPEQGDLIGIALYIGGTALIATLFYYAFEQPILAARPRYSLTRLSEPIGPAPTPE